MNDVFRHYLQQLNHTQRMLCNGSGSWIWLQEVRGTTHVRQADGPPGDTIGWGPAEVSLPGAQSSAVLLDDGQMAVAVLHQNRASVYCSGAWSHAHTVRESANGQLLIGNLVRAQSQLVLPWAVHAPGDAGQVGYSCRAADGVWQHIVLQRAAGAFAPHALVDATGRLHLVWALADQRLFYVDDAIAQPNREPVCIARDGYQPTMVEDRNVGVLVAYESHFSYPKSVAVCQGNVTPAETVIINDPRFHYSVAGSLQLIRDVHGVPTLFWVDRYRHHVFYSRWLGATWAPVLSIPSLFERGMRDERTYQPIGAVHVSGAADEQGHVIVIEPEASAGEPAIRRYRSIAPRDGTICFFDLRELTRLQGFRHRVQTGKKHAKNPFVLPGGDGAFNHYRAVNRCTVVHDGTHYQMWMTGTAVPDAEIGYDWWTKLRSGWSCSDDGVHWRVPREITGLPGQHALAYDPAAIDPAQRFKFVDFLIADEKLIAAQRGSFDLLASDEPGRLFCSADGQRWTSQPIALSTAGGMYFEHCPMCLLQDPDDVDRPWKSYGYASLTLGRRANSLATSRDLIRWTMQAEPALPPERHGYPLQPTGPQSQVHGMTVHRIGSCYIGFVQYQQDAHRSTIELAVSRDGLHFDPVQAGRPLVDRGAPGCWDEGMLMPAGFVETANSWQIYYTGTNLPAAGESIRTSVGLAELPRHGLCALEMTGPAATLETAPITLKAGERYRVVIESVHMEVQVKAVDADGQPVSCAASGMEKMPGISFDAPPRPIRLVLSATGSNAARLFSLSLQSIGGRSA